MVQTDGGTAQVQADDLESKQVIDQEPVDQQEIAREITEAGGRLKQEGPEITQVDFRGQNVSDQMLSKLCRLSNLKLLKLSGRDARCEISSRTLMQLSGLGRLKVFAADFVPLDSEHVVAMGRMQKLTELYLASADIDDSELPSLQSLNGLKKLRLSGNPISDESAVVLASLGSLEDLDISSCKKVSRDTLKAISGLRNLRKLNLYDIPLQDDAIIALAGMSELESLNLDGTQLTDQGLAALAGLQQLTFLHLGWTRITDASIPVLTGFPKLEKLLVHKTAMTQQGFDILKKRLPDTEISTIYVPKQP